MPCVIFMGKTIEQSLITILYKLLNSVSVQPATVHHCILCCLILVSIYSNLIIFRESRNMTSCTAVNGNAND